MFRHYCTIKTVIAVAGVAGFFSCSSGKRVRAEPDYSLEKHRPQIHFTPRTGWMNDPNGMVYFNGIYHLMYQHNPDSTVWGPMHWGHATSKDLIHWEHQPIALYPDSLGTIFSGSAVVDLPNTSGFGRNGKPPLVAIFTHHDHTGEKAGTSTFQNQSLAYSVDESKTWTKYSGNPVLKNPGIRDFRDPKVSWHEASQKWIMTLATLDRITFYSSPNLKDWTKESEFGKNVGAHGGVWECPDLFPLEVDGKTVWVLLVSINPGGPNGGSATQYFTGDFDGKTFTPLQTDTRWIDYGPDNYAGITWFNTGSRKLFMGWMSNWLYANVVPTQRWRSAMTLPRDLALQKIGEKYFIQSVPALELATLEEKTVLLKNINAADFDLGAKIGAATVPGRITLKADSLQDFSLTFSNAAGQKLSVGYLAGTNEYFIDRALAGDTSFNGSFAKRITAPRLASGRSMHIDLVIDHSSLELFADSGLSVLSALFFPDQLLTGIRLQSPVPYTIKTIRFAPLKSMYKK
ncbi:glycoside hydrolase family 32 protein [Flavisolibacter sp. BT320]|nr:glycoside hydrolase family 32 protein [Flavisolibacter longurius]